MSSSGWVSLGKLPLWHFEHLEAVVVVLALLHLEADGDVDVINMLALCKKWMPSDRMPLE